MTLKRVLLGSTALLGAGAMLLTAQEASAQVEVSVGGFARWAVAAGNFNDLTGNNNRRSLYFRNDTEVFVTFRGKDDATGTEYGAKVELEADTNALFNADETWLWIKGSWGELRLGDEDGGADMFKVGGASVAAGTGGIDGMGEVAPVPVWPRRSGDATKIVYISPSMGGLSVALSYTPDSGQGGNATFPATNNGSIENWIEGGVRFQGSFGGADIKASVIGGVGKYEAGTAFPLLGDDFWMLGAGVQVGFGGISVAAGYFAERDDQQLAGDRNIWNVGVGGSVGPVDLSLTFAYVDNQTGVEPRNLVFSATYGLFPGMALQGDIAIWDRDVGANDSGVSGVLRLHIAG